MRDFIARPRNFMPRNDDVAASDPWLWRAPETGASTVFDQYRRARQSHYQCISEKDG